MLGLCILRRTGTEWPKPTCHPPKVIASWCYGDPTQCTRPNICLLSDNQHSLQLRCSIPECNGLWQFKKDTGRSPVPVREINLIAYVPIVQLTENACPDLDLNPGRCRTSASRVQQELWLRKHISPLSHGDRCIVGSWRYKPNSEHAVAVADDPSEEMSPCLLLVCLWTASLFLLSSWIVLSSRWRIQWQLTCCFLRHITTTSSAYIHAQTPTQRFLLAYWCRLITVTLIQRSPSLSDWCMTSVYMFWLAVVPSFSV